MSHFTVLVIGPDPEAQLAPYQENNMGDCPKEYLKYIVHAKDGRHVFDSEELAKVANLELEYDDEPGYWENPNAKWDWYQLGGRWNGFFKLCHTPDKMLPNHKVGAPGIFNEPAQLGRADQAIKGDIDFDSMYNEAETNARNKYKKVLTSFGGTIPQLDWKWTDRIDDAVKLGTVDELSKAYNEQPAVKLQTELRQKLMNLKDPDRDFIFLDIANYQCTEDEYALHARNAVIVTFAVIKDGKWYERGKMGWWEVVSDEKQSTDWQAEFTKLLDALPDDTLLSVYDCHI